MSKDIKAWSEKINGDKGFAKEYKGLKSVKDILAKAKNDGYNITESDLKDFDLSAVAGGAGPFSGVVGTAPSGRQSVGAGGVGVDVKLDTKVNIQKFGNNVVAKNGGKVNNQNSVSFNAGQ